MLGVLLLVLFLVVLGLYVSSRKGKGFPPAGSFG